MQINLFALLLFLFSFILCAQNKVDPERFPIQISHKGLVFDAFSNGTKIRRKLMRFTAPFRIEAHNPKPPPWLKEEDDIKYLHAVAPDFSSLSHKGANSRYVQFLGINEENIIAYTRIHNKKEDTFSYEIITFENLRDYNDYFHNTPYEFSRIVDLDLNKKLSETGAPAEFYLRISRIKNAALHYYEKEIRYYLASHFFISQNELKISLSFGNRGGPAAKFHDDYIRIKREYTLATFPPAMLSLPCDVEIAAEDADERF